MKYTIRVFCAEGGKLPYMDWLRGIKDQKARIAIRLRIDRMEEGNFGRVEPVGEGVSELKIDLGPGYRIYFGMIGKTVVLLLYGGDKKTQGKDIKVAKQYFRDYKAREKEDG
ncbi:MAG: hypothetical protein HW387_1357 [Parachlamydiales bacterium]|nr:hypothetical protein [Parachlamydiales bacterium]